MRKPKIKVINGKKYAYDMQSYWDKEQKKYRKKCVYLGRVFDEENGTYAKKRTDSPELSAILHYGDVYSINACLEHSIYADVFKSVLPEEKDTLMSLICYKLLKSSTENLVVYGKRVLYVKRVQVELFSNIGYAYVICDIKRKADEITRFFIDAKEDGLNEQEMESAMPGKGKFIIISSIAIPINEVIPLYYTRQSAENLFGISKSFLDILPIRTHSIETFRGYLMLTFMALIIYIEYKRMLSGKYTVEGALMEMSNLMCKVYENMELLVSEPTKKMKAICSLLECMEVKTSGV